MYRISSGACSSLSGRASISRHRRVSHGTPSLSTVTQNASSSGTGGCASRCAFGRNANECCADGSLAHHRLHDRATTSCRSDPQLPPTSFHRTKGASRLQSRCADGLANDPGIVAMFPQSDPGRSECPCRPRQSRRADSDDSAGGASCQTSHLAAAVAVPVDNGDASLRVSSTTRSKSWPPAGRSACAVGTHLRSWSAQQVFMSDSMRCIESSIVAGQPTGRSKAADAQIDQAADQRRDALVSSLAEVAATIPVAWNPETRIGIANDDHEVASATSCGSRNGNSAVSETPSTSRTPRRRSKASHSNPGAATTGIPIVDALSLLLDRNHPAFQPSSAGQGCFPRAPTNTSRNSSGPGASPAGRSSR